MAINQTLARRLEAIGREPLGATFTVNGTERQVIAVVADVKHEALDGESGREFYVPYTQAPSFFEEYDLVVRAADPMALVPSIQRFANSMFTAFAGIALFLAAVGLYAITAYAATQRTREIGVRVALGAEARQVWWLVTRRAARQLGLGLLIGGSGGIAVARALPSQLAGVRGGDPATLAAVAALLIAVALAATFVPARRAMRLDPVAALRAE